MTQGRAAHPDPLATVAPLCLLLEGACAARVVALLLLWDVYGAWLLWRLQPPR